MSSLVNLGTVALQTSINTLGTDIIVAHTAARKISELFMLIFSVFGTTMATFCGQNLGAGEIRRIREGIKKSVLYSWIWCLGVIVVTWLFAPDLIYLVTGSSNPVVIKNAVAYLRFDTLFYFVTALICVIRNAMQGIGDHITPLVSSSLELVGKVVFALIFVPLLGYRGVIPCGTCILVYHGRSAAHPDLPYSDLKRKTRRLGEKLFRPSAHSLRLHRFGEAGFYFKNPFTICSSASFSVSPSVISLIS